MFSLILYYSMFMYFSGIYVYSSKYKHLLMVISLYMIMSIYLINYAFEMFFLIIFSVFSVCEGVTDFDSTIRSYGNDFFKKILLDFLYVYMCIVYDTIMFIKEFLVVDSFFNIFIMFYLFS